MKKKVLIADADGQFCAELITALNDSQKFEVVGTAADGEETIQMLQTNQADVLVIDLLLAKYDGITVLQRMQDACKDMGILVTTPFLSNYVATAVAKMGIKQLLCKPCSAETVVDSLQKIL